LCVIGLLNYIIILPSKYSQMSYKSLFTALAFIFCTGVAYGQFGYSPYRHERSYSSYGEKGKTWLKRAYLSASLPFMNLELDSKLNINRTVSAGQPSYGPSVDTSIYLNKKCSGSYGFAAGSFFPIARINDHQMIALDCSFGGYIYEFNYGIVNYSSIDIVTDKADFYLFDLPICLQYKSGGEVKLDPEQKVLFSIGGGFDPTLTLGGYNSAGGALFKIRPFVMTEIGLYFGLAAKIRFTYYPGTIIMVNDTEDGLSGNNNSGSGTFTVLGTGSGNFLVSLVILYHSTHWGDDK